MSKPIFEPSFWKGRLEAASTLHHSVYRCHDDLWHRSCENFSRLLAKHIKPFDFVLDVGCAYGRLLDLMPKAWTEAGSRFRYRGIDISPDFIELATRKYPGVQFNVMDIRNIPEDWYGQFDWAVLGSIKGMVIREAGEDVWQEMRKKLKRCARRLLIIEYNPDDPEEVDE